MVGTNIGAGQRARALRIALTGGAVAFALTEAVGLAAAIWPHAWLGLSDTRRVTASFAAAALVLASSGRVASTDVVDSTKLPAGFSKPASESSE